jgi:hypothetical protein
MYMLTRLRLRTTRRVALATHGLARSNLRPIPDGTNFRLMASWGSHRTTRDTPAAWLAPVLSVSDEVKRGGVDSGSARRYLS